MKCKPTCEILIGHQKPSLGTRYILIAYLVGSCILLGRTQKQAISIHDKVFIMARITWVLQNVRSSVITDEWTWPFHCQNRTRCIFIYAREGKFEGRNPIVHLKTLISKIILWSLFLMCLAMAVFQVYVTLC